MVAVLLLCPKMLQGDSLSYSAILPVFAKPSSSTFLPHPELTSCANLPSKAAFNYFLVPGGGQGAPFSRGAALAPVVALLWCAPRCSRELVRAT